MSATSICEEELGSAPRKAKGRGHDRFGVLGGQANRPPRSARSSDTFSRNARLPSEVPKPTESFYFVAFR